MKKHLFAVFPAENALSITLNFSKVLLPEMKNTKIENDQRKLAAKNNNSNPFYSFISICMPNVNLKQSDLGYKK